MRRREKFGLAAITLALVAASAGRTYRNEAMRVQAFSPPSGWELAPQSTYPRILATYSSKEARMTLSAQAVAPATQARDVVEQSRRALEKEGFADIRVEPEGAGVRLTARLDGGRRMVRQRYLVDGGIAYVVTLVAPAADEGWAGPDFEEAVRSLQLGAGPLTR